MFAKRTLPAWIPCPHCENFWCTLHGVHVFECPCPPIEEWESDPYSDTQPETRTMNATNRQIEIWLDETSDGDEPMWCVSLCESDGEEVRCLSTHDDLATATAAAKKSAATRNLPLFTRSKHGSLS